jgi:hypothetical protein
MADQTVPVMYPNTSATTEGAIPADRQPPNFQQTHPTKGAHDPAPEVRHAEDHDSETGDRALEER